MKEASGNESHQKKEVNQETEREVRLGNEEQRQRIVEVKGIPGMIAKRRPAVPALLWAAHVQTGVGGQWAVRHISLREKMKRTGCLMCLLY